MEVGGSRRDGSLTKSSHLDGKKSIDDAPALQPGDLYPDDHHIKSATRKVSILEDVGILDKHTHFIKSFTQKIEHIRELLDFEPAEAESRAEVQRLRLKWRNDALGKYERRLERLGRWHQEVVEQGARLERERLIIGLRSVVCHLSNSASALTSGLTPTASALEILMRADHPNCRDKSSSVISLHGCQIQPGSDVLKKEIDLVFTLNIPPLDFAEDSEDDFGIDIILKLHTLKPASDQAAAYQILSNTLRSSDLQSSEINRF